MRLSASFIKEMRFKLIYSSTILSISACQSYRRLCFCNHRVDLVPFHQNTLHGAIFAVAPIRINQYAQLLIIIRGLNYRLSITSLIYFRCFRVIINPRDIPVSIMDVKCIKIVSLSSFSSFSSPQR